MSDQDAFKDIQITTTLPKSWEEERTFNDVLYDWLGRAPYLAVAVAIHLLGIFLLHLVDWQSREEPDEKIVQATIEAPPIEEFEEPPPPEPEEVEEVEIVDPVIVESVVDEEVQVDEPEDMPFDNPNNANTEIGIGGGGGGGTGKGRAGRRKTVRAPIAAALQDALEWLKDHQNPQGYWDCDGFMVECDLVGQPLSDGPGEPLHDVGVTGLATLAFLGYGDTLKEGQYQDVINRAVKWLREQQQESGLIGEQIDKEFMYDHAIATLAICEAYYTAGRPPLLQKHAQKAVNFINQARNPYAAWRYSALPDGDNDTSVTGWMVFALAAAQEGGIKVDPDAFRGALSWFDEMTDPTTGRVGYDREGGRGGPSSRTTENKHYPRDAAETMTAVATLGRIFALNALKNSDAETQKMIELGADLMSKKLPTWSDDGLTNDMYYWYYGSYAMFQMGGKHWGAWEKAMEKALLPNQRKDGCFKGSWDPNGPWGSSGGRVYSTALMCLNLEVFFRYTKLTGTR